MTVDFTYQVLQFLVNKNQDGYLSPDQFNLIINQSQNSWSDYLLGQFQQYIPGKPQSRVQYSENQITRQRLAPVIYGYILNPDPTGFAPYPGDYVQTDAMWTIYGNGRIRYTEQEHLYSTVNSSIDPVATNPIYLIEDEGFRFYPLTIGQAKLNYVRNPPAIIWGYTEDSENRPVYNPATSADPVWADVDMLEIISRALRMVGVNLQANVVSQYANEIKDRGQ